MYVVFLVGQENKLFPLLRVFVVLSDLVRVIGEHVQYFQLLLDHHVSLELVRVPVVLRVHRVAEAVDRQKQRVLQTALYAVLGVFRTTRRPWMIATSFTIRRLVLLDYRFPANLAQQNVGLLSDLMLRLFIFI